MQPSIFTAVINSYLPEPHATLLNGIIFGIPVKSSQNLYTELKTVGLVHLVVLSGMNITLLSSIITSLTFKLGKSISTVINIFTVIAFIIFVGAQPSVVRAGCMGILNLVAMLYGRKTIALYSLLLSAIFIGIFWPEWISSISFQLSFTATLGLILFSKKAGTNKDSKKKQTNLTMEYIKDELRTSLAAQFLTIPIIWIYFKQISFIAPISHLVIAWTVAPLMIFGFMTAVLGYIHHSLGILPSYICFVLLNYIVTLVHLLSQIPFAYYTVK